jgi:hypothetical protein
MCWVGLGSLVLSCFVFCLVLSCHLPRLVLFRLVLSRFVLSCLVICLVLSFVLSFARSVKCAVNPGFSCQNVRRSDICFSWSCHVLCFELLCWLLLSCLVLCGLVSSSLFLSCSVLSCCLLVSCLVFCCVVICCVFLRCLVWSGLVLSCLVLSCLVLCCLVLCCLLLSLDDKTPRLQAMLSIFLVTGRFMLFNIVEGALGHTLVGHWSWSLVFVSLVFVSLVVVLHFWSLVFLQGLGVVCLVCV